MYADFYQYTFQLNDAKGNAVMLIFMKIVIVF